MNDDMWAGTNTTPLSPHNPFDPNDSPELYEEWNRQAAADAAQAKQAAENNGRRLTATTADTLTMRAPRWLYDWRIPTGAITLLAGREGIGKSTISYDLTARITRGTLPGRHYGTPKAVAVVAGEDSWESVILPRLVAAGADLTKVYRVEALTEDDRDDTVSVPADLQRLATLCAEKDIVLVILDPFMSVIHSSLDTHKDREVRKALDPLARFAAITGVAILGLIHINKTATTDPLTSIMASRAFAAVARSVLYCLLDPEAEREDRYLLGHPKSNLGPNQITLRYHMIGVKLEVDDAEEPTVVTSKVVWDGQDDRTIREAMESADRTGRPVGELATDLQQWITQQGRTVSTAEIIAEFSDIERATLDTSLGRMVKRGTLYRPIRGHYAIKQSELSEALEVSEESGASQLLTGLLSLQEASEREDVSEVLTDLTDLSSNVTPRARQKLEPMSQWAADLYDRE